TTSYDFPVTSTAPQQQLGGGTCDYFGGPCGDAFVMRITDGGPGTVPPVSLVATPTDTSPGGVVTATWADLSPPPPIAPIQVFTLGSTANDASDVIVWWQTTGTAAGTLSLLLPPDLAAGSYELRLVTADPDHSGLPGVIARSAPIHVDGTPATSTTT